MDSGLRDKRYVVTGASGGIGAEICRVLAAEGARIGVHYGRGRQRAQALVTELDQLGAAETHVLAADLRSETEVDSMVSGFADRFGGLDGLVANAGVWPRDDTPIRELSLERWNETLTVNLTGAFLSCRAFLRSLGADQKSPALVLIGSTAAVYGEAGHGDYAAAKSALVGLMLSIKNEIVRTALRGRINLIHPGWVATPMARAALEDAQLVERITSTIALRKVAVPEDIAHAVAFLLSERLSGHLSGTVLPIAGGIEGRVLHPERQKE